MEIVKNIMKRLNNVKRNLTNSSGQSSVEFALVMVAFLSIVIALFTITKICENGVFSNLAIGAASHTSNNILDEIKDILLY